MPTFTHYSAEYSASEDGVVSERRGLKRERWKGGRGKVEKREGKEKKKRKEARERSRKNDQDR